MSSSSEEESETIKKKASSITNKTKKRYLHYYMNFMDWKSQKGKESISEDVLIEFFREYNETHSPTTSQCRYSMLKTVLLEKHNIDFSNFKKLRSFIKHQQSSVKSKKTTRLLTAENVEKFLNEAPDYIFLAHKVALILGVSGACRGTELLHMTLKDLNKTDNSFFVDLPRSRTGANRSFVIRREDHVDIINKYLALRPEDLNHRPRFTNRLFIQYRDGKCAKQVIGKSKIAEFPSEVAEYLKLPEPKKYTGECFRKSLSLWHSKLPDRVYQDEIRQQQDNFKMVTDVADSEEIEIAVQYSESEVSTKFQDTDDVILKNLSKDCLDDNSFDIEDDWSLKQIKEEVCELKSLSPEKEAESIDPLKHRCSSNFLKINKANNPGKKLREEATKPKITINQETNDTTISLPNKTVKLVFRNCKNVSNITINL